MKKFLLSILILLSFAVCCGGTFLLSGCDQSSQSEIETPDKPDDPKDEDKKDDGDGNKKDDEDVEGKTNVFASLTTKMTVGSKTYSIGWSPFANNQISINTTTGTEIGKRVCFSWTWKDSDKKAAYTSGQSQALISESYCGSQTWTEAGVNTGGYGSFGSIFANGRVDRAFWYKFYVQVSPKVRDHYCSLDYVKAGPFGSDNMTTYYWLTTGQTFYLYGNNGLTSDENTACNNRQNEGEIQVEMAYKANIVQINLNKNGGSGGTNYIYYAYGDSKYYTTRSLDSQYQITKVVVPTRAGYLFSKYVGNGTQGSTNGELYAQTSGTLASDLCTDFWSDATLTAQWTPITYTLHYDGNGNTGGSMSDETHTYDTQFVATKNAFTKTGYSLAGWKMTGFNSSTAQYYEGGWKSFTSDTVFVDGEDFKNLTTVKGGVVTLHAQWRANSYTATFDTNGGKVSPSSKSVTYDSTYGDLPEPTRPGYAFAGWKLSCLNEGLVATRTDTSWLTGWYTGIALKDIGVNLTVGSKYRFAFDIKTIDGTETIPWNENRFFVNDNTKPDSLVNDMTKKPATSTSGITSTWTRYSAEFTYATDTTSSWKNDQIHIYPNFTDKTTQVQMTNIELVCLTSGKVTSSTTVKTDRDHKLFAQWTPNTYTLTLNANGGTGTTTKTVTRDTVVGELPVPTRQGYTFKGWVGNMFANYRPNIVGTTEYCILGTKTNQKLKNYADYTAIIKYKRPTNTSGTVDIFGDGSWLGLGNAPASDTLRTYTYHFNAGRASAWTHGGADYIQFFNIPSQNKESSPADLIEIAIYRMKINGDAVFSGYVCDEDVLTSNSYIRMSEDSTVFASWVPDESVVTFDTNGGKFGNQAIHIDSDLNKWTIESKYAHTFSKISYSNRKNYVVTYGSILYWEHAYKTFTLRAGYSYTFSSYYNILTEITYQNTSFTESKGMRMQLFSGSTPPNKGGGEVAMCNFGYAVGSGRKSFTYNCTTTGTYCLSYNFGWLGNAEEKKLEVGDITLTTNDPNFKSTIAVTYDQVYGTLPTPTRDNYEFMGWSGAASVPDFSEWTLSNGATYDASTGILTLGTETASASSPLIDVGEISSFYFYIYAMSNVETNINTAVTYYSNQNTSYSGNGWAGSYTGQGVDVGKWGWVRTMYGSTTQIKAGTCRYVRVSISRSATYAPQTYYVKKCMIATTDDYKKTYTTATTKVSTGKNHFLVADWKPVARTVAVRVMSSGVNGKTPNEYTQSSAGLRNSTYDYWTCPTNGNDTKAASGALSTAYMSIKHANRYTFVLNSYANDGYVFLGYTLTNTVPTLTSPPSSTCGWNITADTTIYLWFKKVSTNCIQFDEEEGFWYFEDGKTLQSYVGDELNATLNNNIDKTSGSFDNVVYYKNQAEQKVKLYNYNGETYGWAKATKTYTMTKKRLKLNTGTSVDGAKVTYSNDGYTATVEAPVVSGNTYSSSFIQMYNGSSYPEGKLISQVGKRKCYEFTKTAAMQWVRFKYNGSTADATFFITGLLKNGHTYRFSYDEELVSGATSGKATNISLTEVYNFEKDQTYWFKYEPIRWRVTDVGIVRDSFSAGIGTYWSELGVYHTGFMYVSDRIIYASQMTSGQYDLGVDKAGYLDTWPSKFKENAYSMDEKIRENTFDYLISISEYYTKFDLKNNGNDSTKVAANFKLRVASVSELQTNFTDLRAKPTDYVAFLLGVSPDQYCNYFTRDVGKKYYNMTGIGVDGRVHDYYTNNFMGMRLAMNFSEGSRYYY